MRGFGELTSPGTLGDADWIKCLKRSFFFFFFFSLPEDPEFPSAAFSGVYSTWRSGAAVGMRMEIFVDPGGPVCLEPWIRLRLYSCTGCTLLQNERLVIHFG